MTRSQKEILRDIQTIHCALEPENLYRDGELSKTDARQEAIRLMKDFQKLETELGRIPTEEEIWDF